MAAGGHRASLCRVIAAALAATTPVTGTCGPSHGTGCIPLLGSVSILAIVNWISIGSAIPSIAALGDVRYLILTT